MHADQAGCCQHPKEPAGGKCHVTLMKTELQAECRRSRCKLSVKAKCMRSFAGETISSVQAELRRMQQVAADIDHASACTVLAHRRTEVKHLHVTLIICQCSHCAHPQKAMSSPVTSRARALAKGLPQTGVKAHTTPSTTPAVTPMTMLKGP